MSHRSTAHSRKSSGISTSDLPWSVQDAQALRQQVKEQLEKRSHRIPVWMNTPIRLALAAVDHIPGVSVYDKLIDRVTARMNANAETAFDHYQPGAGDVVVSAYFKAGTNWAMYLCHEIAHHGLAEFDHIQDVIPWPDAAQPRFWQDVRDTSGCQSASGLRVIKSHLAATRIPVNRAAKYIAVTRDPKDCAASGYHFFKPLMFGPTAPPPKQWLKNFASDNPPFGPWDEFSASWYQRRHEPNVLFLRFEEMKNNIESTVERIADFMGVTLDAVTRQRVLDKTSFKTMQSINHKFYPASQSIWTQPDGKIIRSGKVGGGNALFARADLDFLDQHFERQLLLRSSDLPYREWYRGSST